MNIKATIIDMPYPEVEIDWQSASDVRCMMDIYAGVESEMTGTLQYLYQSYVTSAEDMELARLFRGIAIAEMSHHELLGEVIVKLGGTPVIGGNRQFWNGAMVNYTKDIKAMIDSDIKSEEKAIELYRKAIRCVDNYSIKELIERIILDEELHIMRLTEFKSTLLERK